MLLASLLLVMPISKYNIFVEGWPALLANPDAALLAAAPQYINIFVEGWPAWLVNPDSARQLAGSCILEALPAILLTA